MANKRAGRRLDLINLAARDINDVADAIERASQLRVSSPLFLEQGDSGRTISLAWNAPIYAQLSGDSSPYSWEEILRQSGDSNVSGYLSGEGNAYETNGRSGLDGEIVLLRPTVAGDWRFHRVGFTPPPPPACGGIICVAASTQCSGPAPTVVLMQGGTPIDSTVVRSQVYLLTLGGGGGSGYTNGTDYALAFSGGSPTTPAQGKFDVVAGKVTNVRLTSGGDGYGSAPSVSVAAAGGGTGATVTASVGARACFGSVPYGSGYKFVATSPDFFTRETTTFTVPPCTNSGSSLSLPPKYRLIGVRDVLGCGGSVTLDGVEVEASQNGTTETQYTDASGDCDFATQWMIYDSVLQPYPVSLVFRADRYQDRNASFNLGSGCIRFIFSATSTPAIFGGSGCLGDTFEQGDVADGYACTTALGAPFGPISQNLILTEPTWGSTANLDFVGCTTYGPSMGSAPTWEGTGTASIPALCSGLASNCGIGQPLESFSCDPVDLEIRWKLHGETLYAEWDTHLKVCPNSGQGGKRCMGPGPSQLTGSAVFSVSSATEPPTMLMLFPLPGNQNDCTSPFGTNTGDISLVEA